MFICFFPDGFVFVKQDTLERRRRRRRRAIMEFEVHLSLLHAT